MSVQNAIDEFDELEPPLTETGKPTESRLTSARAAYGLYKKFKEDDSKPAADRAKVQAMLDGEAPYSARALRNAGQSFRTNVNFGDAGTLLEDSLAAYLDMAGSTETLMTVKTTYGEDPIARTEWEQAIAEELTTLIRHDWDEFHINFLLLALSFLGHGLSLAFFPDETDWRFDVGDLATFKLPKNVRSSVSNIQIAFARKEMGAHELWNYIKDEDQQKRSEAVGWHPNAVKQAIIRAHKDGSKNRDQLGDWEAVQRKAKECDLWLSEESEQIPVVHVWVQEMSGEVSHFIIEDNEALGKAEMPTTNDTENKGEFLYKKIGRFESMGRALVTFTYGIGSHGTYGSVRGLGNKIFPRIQIINRLGCKNVDGALMASTPVIQPKSTRDLNEAQMVFTGPFAILRPSANLVSTASQINPATTTMPVLREVREGLRGQTASYNPHDALPDREITRGEAGIRTNNAFELSTTSRLYFYLPWEKLIREITRRISKRNYPSTSPGGDLVELLKERLALRGIPEEALYLLDHSKTTAVRAVGAGSARARAASYDELLTIAASMDEMGRRNLMRDKAASVLGDYSIVDRYFPPSTADRTSVDYRLAIFENLHLEKGDRLLTNPDDLHFDHLTAHLQRISEIVALVDQGQMGLTEAAPGLANLHDHAGEHLEAVEGDVVLRVRVQELRAQMQRAGEIILNGIRKLRAQQEEAAQNPEGGQQAAQSAEDAEFTAGLERKLIEFNQKLSLMREESAVKMRIKEAEAAQQRRLRDAETAANLTRPKRIPGV